MTGKFNYQTTYFWTAGDTHNKVKYKEPTDKKIFITRTKNKALSFLLILYEKASTNCCEKKDE